MAGLTGGLSFQRHLSPAIQFTETFPTPHQYFPLAATLLLSNSLADDVFDPPTSFSFRYAHRSAYSLLQSSMPALTFFSTSWQACSKVAFARLSRNCPDFTGVRGRAAHGLEHPLQAQFGVSKIRKTKDRNTG